MLQESMFNLLTGRNSALTSAQTLLANTINRYNDNLKTKISQFFELKYSRIAWLEEDFMEATFLQDIKFRAESMHKFSEIRDQKKQLLLNEGMTPEEIIVELNKDDELTELKDLILKSRIRDVQYERIRAMSATVDVLSMEEKSYKMTQAVIEALCVQIGMVEKTTVIFFNLNDDYILICFTRSPRRL